jgi:hypothetical protein
MNKKMSYNVNAIVGKYIMPVTIHTEYKDVKRVIKKGIDITTGKQILKVELFREPINIRLYCDDVIGDSTFEKLDEYTYSNIRNFFSPLLNPFKGKIRKYFHKGFYVLDTYHCLNGKVIRPYGGAPSPAPYCSERKNVAYPYACKRGYNKVVDLFNKLLDRYKPTSKYYMAFARISEYFY